jgi:glucose-6-phosphate-specific signal transduction histidine kinase
VTLAAAGDALELVVDDDGCGRTGATDGIGTASMRERAVELGGDIHIGPGAGVGTRVSVRIPRLSTYLSNVLAKIHAADRADAVLRARRAGLG